MTPPLRPLMNRMKDSGEFELPVNHWYHLAPLGEFPHSDSGLVQVVDRKSVEAMASAFDPGQELLVDFDHESWDSDKRTTAAGWVQNLVAREDGIWGLIRWSTVGREAVEGREYRFLSPVWAAADCESAGPGRVRPLKLSDAGLTNRPNLNGLRALSNRDVGGELKPRIHAADSETFLNAVRDIQAARRLPFEHAWEAARLERPALYGALNRRHGPHEADGQAIATAKHAAFRSHQNNPYLIYDRLVREHAAHHNTSYDRAFDSVKLTHPAEYSQVKDGSSKEEFCDPRHH